MNTIDVATIGFTQTSAKDFFERLAKANIKSIIDVRLHNRSQLSGFAKADDLAYFLNIIAGIEYVHEPLLAPTEELFTAYKKRKIDWKSYERDFLELMAQRRIESELEPEEFHRSCLLCSEAKPHYCHRRLICEYLNEKWTRGLSVRHL
jgi:uncharacterized protein (DUF488 family)